MVRLAGCPDKSVAKGLCDKHYMRQRRTGDAEQVRLPGRKPDPRLSRLRSIMGPNFGSRSTFYRYDLANRVLASARRCRGSQCDLGGDSPARFYQRQQAA